ncbi:hypothetical protein [Nocardioides sp.]|uniref:hypothetical protein n=1 Tax=Nocardioides sp. TaxID=35761 RepID=UPI002639F2E5|nr:hypothetical protein [Nocardioides sp.]MDI6908224.1 hypothetical protein [Nocardioides sp.]
MASFVPSSPATLEDQRLYTRARLVEVACLDCLATVGVKKNSEHHTSIQWSDQALGHCQEFARMATQPGGRPVHAGCPRLAASIDAAAREGRIPIGAEDGY